MVPRLRAGKGGAPPPRPAVARMHPYDPPTAARRGKLRLDFNESTVGPPRAVRRAIAAVDGERLAAYPDPQEARGAAAAYAGVPVENLLLVNGTDEAIRTVFTTFVDPGQTVVIPVPTFAMYRFYGELAAARIVEVPYARDLSFPAAAVERALAARPRPRALFLANPNNPTGTAVPLPRLGRIVAAAAQAGALAVVDEAYYEFHGETAIDWIHRFPNLVVLRTFSKAFGLAGLRVGYAAADRRVIDLLARASSPYAVNGLASVAVAAALGALGPVRRHVFEVRHERPRLRRGLARLGIPTVASQANFLLARVGPRASEVRARLAAAGVLVRDRSRYPLLEGCLRIGVGTRRQNRRLLAELGRALRPRAILFDLDGVLVDVSRSYREAIRRTASHFLGRPVSRREVEREKSRPGANSDWVATERIIRAGGGLAPQPAVVAYFQRLYLGGDGGDGLVARERWLLDPPDLAWMAERYLLGIVTGRPRREAELALACAGARRFFGAIVALEDIRRPKPAPDGIRRALALLAAASPRGLERAVYVGDALDDRAAARAAGIGFVAVAAPGNAPLLRAARRDGHPVLARAGDLRALLEAEARATM